jgi:lactate dehydrogenase-like 2-hydroxyacid dehydrogenase
MTTKPDVLVVVPSRPDQMRMLDEAYTLHRHDRAEDPDALLEEAAPGIRAVVTMGSVGFTRDMLERLPRLEIVAVGSVGYDTVDVEGCKARGVPVTNTPDVLTDDVADVAMALAFATLRAFGLGERWVREGRWRDEGAMPLTTTMTGKTLGILGFGRIGKAIAKRAGAAGMKIAYHGRRKQEDVRHPYYDDPVSLARDCDVLMLSCPGGEDTRNLVSRPVLEALGPDGHLVNIARGSVVDEPVLLEFLQQNRIAGAGLDVFENEPAIDERFFGLDNVVLQPHIGSATVETRNAMAQLVVDNLAAHFAGRPLLTPV